MISRRLIRVKVFKMLFGCVHGNEMDLARAQRELQTSLDRTRQLYFFLLALPEALGRYAQERIDIGLQKYKPTEEELHPNLRFVENRFLAQLVQDSELTLQQEQKGLNWSAHRSFIKGLWDELKEEDYYKEYMQQPASYKNDLKFWKIFYSYQLEDNPQLDALIEDMSLYWEDDTAYVCNVILGILDKAHEGQPIVHPDLFFKEDDADFARRLLSQSLVHYNEYEALLREFAANWEGDRMSATDALLIIMGIAEAVAFPTIPIKVTFNEMVELAKAYSTSNSKTFVNGLLDKIVKHLVENGTIVKQGRGLLEN